MNESLSPSELRTLTRAAEGASNKVIAAERGIGVETVKHQLRFAFAKLGATNRTHAAHIAMRAGLIRIGDQA